MGIVSDAAQSGGDIMRRLRNLEKDIRSLQTARRLESAAVGAGGMRVHGGGSVRLQDGGSVQVEDGGDVDIHGGVAQLFDTNGNVIVRVSRGPTGGGAVQTLYPSGTVATHVGEVEGIGGLVTTGIFFQAEDGTDILNVGRRESGAPPTFDVFDHQGARAVGTDEGSDGLLDRPYLDVPMHPLSSLGNYSTDTDPESIIFHGALWITHPYIRVIVRAWCGVSTTGIIRLGMFEAGGAAVQIGNNINVSSETADFYDFGWQQLPAEALSNPYGFRRLFVTAERTSGTNLVIVQPYMTTKGGTP